MNFFFTALIGDYQIMYSAILKSQNNMSAKNIKLFALAKQLRIIYLLYSLVNSMDYLLKDILTK